jgi:muramoyltetrapeptide carboxypeptidase
LKPGAAIGLFAPAHAFDRGEMERGAAMLRSWGLTVKIPKKLGRRDRYLAGDDAHRLAVLAELMEDESVDGLMAVRGGFGCQRLLPALAPLWSRWPAKPIFGFSDLTALHLARFQASGVAGYHAPMVVSLGKAAPGQLADRPSQADLRRALTSGDRSGGWAFAPRDILKPGHAEGPLLGGNLTLLTALASGPWLPDFTGAILLVEDIDEPPYRLDRLLTTLRQSPIWERAAGLVFGAFTRCGPPAEVRRLLKEAAADFAGPVLCRAPFGHEARNRLFPIGALAELKAQGFGKGYFVRPQLL